jgi:hypothetical protein
MILLKNPNPKIEPPNPKNTNQNPKKPPHSSLASIKIQTIIFVVKRFWK